MPENGLDATGGAGKKPQAETSVPPSTQPLLAVILILGGLFIMLGLVLLFTPLGDRVAHTAARVLGIHTAPGVEIGPLVLSAGLTDQQKPAHPGTKFGERDLKNNQLIAYAEFSNAIPNATEIRVRWIINGAIFDAEPIHVSHSQGAFACPLARDVPTGTHQVNLFVNGTPKASVAFIVTEGSLITETEAQARTRAKRAERASVAPSKRKYPVEQTIILQQSDIGQPGSAPVELQQQQATAPLTQAQVPAPPAEPTKYFVTHKHRFGSCTGTLELRGPNIIFHSNNPDEGERAFPRSTLTPIKDGFLTEIREKFHFAIDKKDAGQVILDWLAR